RPAGAVEQMRRVEHQKVEPGRGGGKDRSLAAVHGRISMHWRASFDRLQLLRKAGNERSGRNALPAKSNLQRAGNVDPSAGLDQWIDLGRDRENLHQVSLSRIRIRQLPSLSIISCVIRQMPFSETRNRFASSAGSSPTTSPSGMRTPWSMTTRFSLALRPT